MKTKTIIISAGHDRFTSGKRSPDGKYLEYAGNRKFARAFEIFCAGYCQCVDLVGNSNLIVSLKARVQSANLLGTKLDSVFIAIHSNAVFNWWTKHRGFTIFYSKWSKKSKLLAECIEKEVAKKTSIKSRGIKGVLWMYVLNKTKMPAILFERGMHTNKLDLALMEKEMDLQASGVIEGIKLYDILKGDL
jgi:N-acetylmuramoyl-L-alanine amidase